MVQIIQEKRRPSFSEKLGKGFGGALSKLSEAYVQNKMSERENEAIKKQIGIDLSEIRDPEARKQIISSSLQGQQKQQSFNEQLNANRQMLRAIEKERGLESGALSGYESDPRLGELTSRQQKEKPPLGGLTGQSVPPEVSQAANQILQQFPNTNADQLKMLMDESGIPPIYSNGYVENRRRQDERSETQDYQSFKDNNQYIEKILNGYEGYKREKAVLDQMETIANKGNMPTPLLVQSLGKVGLPIGILENPDAEQFEKLTQELMKGIQGTYGNRILQSEVQMFMKSIPTLLNSPEGQKRLIQQWKILNEGKKIYYDSYKDVKSKHPKRLPPDLHEKVIENSEGRLDKMAEKFGRLADIPSDYVKTPGKFLVLSPDGEMGEVNASELDEAIKAGYEYLE